MIQCAWSTTGRSLRTARRTAKNCAAMKNGTCTSRDLRERTFSRIAPAARSSQRLGKKR